jgi:hypothetical protein
LKRLLAVALFAAAALLPLSTCRSTKHTVARMVTPAAVPTEVFVPAPAAPAASRPTVTRAARSTAVPATAPPAPSRTPTIGAMRVVTPQAGAPEERSPGVLYEQYVPTVVAVTPIVTPISTRAVSPRSTRPARTPTSAATQKPGVYYEDPEGRPLTPTSQG